ncbi:MAG: hypothetical protein B6244_02595 [Candidatus Cloacimonetes bacterium 4572_55]|nr:MAG: hypothetical protein B6244_02595 [Candidatus Cloacimonetes bacterium 4572_55]
MSNTGNTANKNKDGRKHETVTKRDIIVLVSEKTGSKKKVVAPIVEKIFEAMKESLEAEKRIEIRGFGVFDVKCYKAKPARNPRTGEEVFVEAHKKPFFKPGKELKARVNATKKDVAPIEES